MAITNHDGNLVDEMSYDPWGRPRDPDTWRTCYREDGFISRGFTGHSLSRFFIGEHIEGFGLINMNSLSRSFIGSRIYDPVLGRFLSPYNYVQLPEFARGYNRYAYALNNPLVYTDPDGENPIFLLFIGMTLFTGGHVIHDQVVAGNLSPYWNQWSNVMVGGGTMMMGMGMGAAAGLAAPAFAESFFGGAAYYGGTTFFSSYTFNMIFNDMSRSEAAKYAALSSILPAIGGGLKGGLTALGQGENFWWGTEVGNKRNALSLFNWDKPNHIVDFDMPYTGDLYEKECLAKALYELEQKYGGNRSLNDFKELLGTTMEGTELTINDFRDISSLLENLGFSNEQISGSNLANYETVLQYKQQNNAIGFTKRVRRIDYHFSNIDKIKFYPDKTRIIPNHGVPYKLKSGMHYRYFLFYP